MRNAIVLWLAALLTIGCAKKIPRELIIEQQLKASIPSHAAPDQVLRYLDQHRIAHSGYQRNPTTGNTIIAVIRDPSRDKQKLLHWNIVQTDYGITFRFDDQNHLMNFTVVPMYTGP